MASGDHVTLRGRFSPGTTVQLIKVAGAHVLSPEGGDVVDEQEAKANDQGVSEVRFTKGVDENVRYFVRGLQDGSWLNVRVRGRAADDPGEMSQPPVQGTPVRIGTGGQYDPAKARTKESPPAREAQPHLGMHQTPKGTVLRSDTPFGSAHPVDLPEPAPYSSQQDVPEKVVQMSDTEFGRAAPLEVGPQRQEDVPKGMWQRSDTPTGVATPLPKGNAVSAQEAKESTDSKERRGDPGQAAASPIEHAKPVTGASQKDSEKRHEDLAKSVTEAAAAAPIESDPSPADTSGRDATGQPVSEDVGTAAGVEPASKPSEPVNRPAKRSSGASSKSSGGSAKSSSTRSKSSSKSTTAKKEN